MCAFVVAIGGLVSHVWFPRKACGSSRTLTSTRMLLKRKIKHTRPVILLIWSPQSFIRLNQRSWDFYCTFHTFASLQCHFVAHPLLSVFWFLSLFRLTQEWVCLKLSYLSDFWEGVYPSLQRELKDPSQFTGLRWLYRFRVIPGRCDANCH